MLFTKGSVAFYLFQFEDSIFSIILKRLDLLKSEEILVIYNQINWFLLVACEWKELIEGN